MHDSIAVIDFGAQYAQLITRRIRELQVYCELYPWDAPADQVLSISPRGFILSGGPASVYQPDAPQIASYILDSGLPILGICYGMQALTYALGGKVAPSAEREYGSALYKTRLPNPLLPDGDMQVWMSHGDRIDTTPPGFQVLGDSQNSPVAAIGDITRNYYGLQFHPEVHHTPRGSQILRRFTIDICGASPTWTPASIISQSIDSVRHKVGKENILSAVSGGVDSSVATALVQSAVGDQLVAVFVDTGMLRQDEAGHVKASLQENLGVELIMVDAVDKFMSSLKGVIDPERKREIIGELFIRIFEEQAQALGLPPYLLQGTIYPDVVESERAGPLQSPAHQNPSQCGRPADRHKLHHRRTSQIPV